MPCFLLNELKATVPRLDADLAANRRQLEGAAVSAKGKKDGGEIEVSLHAPHLATNSEGAAGEHLTGTVKASGKDAFDLKFSLSGLKGVGGAPVTGRLAMAIDRAGFGEATVIGRLAAEVSADVAAKSLELAKIEADLLVTYARMPMKSVKMPVIGRADADFARDTARGEFTLSFGESRITAKARVTGFSDAAVDFDAVIDKLNVDKYFPPQPAAAGGKPMDFTAWKALNANGTVKIGLLQMNNIKGLNVVLNFKAAGAEKAGPAPVPGLPPGKAARLRETPAGQLH